MVLRQRLLVLVAGERAFLLGLLEDLLPEVLQLAIAIPQGRTWGAVIGSVIGAAAAVGGGAIWSMHFIGMNAADLGIPVAYDPVLTITSLILSILAPALGLFIVFHILQFTTGTLGPHYVKEAVYANVVNAFKLWYVTIVYIAAMAALALHLYHGVWSMTQTLGLNRPSINKAIYRFSQASAAVIFLGFISVPVAVLMGVRP